MNIELLKDDIGWTAAIAILVSLLEKVVEFKRPPEEERID